MGVSVYGPVLSANQITTQIAHLSFAEFFDDDEEPLASGTAPAPPSYDDAVAVAFACDTRTDTGTVTNLFWTIWRVPSGYSRASDLVIMMDGIYVLGGDGVMVAATLDCEVFLYDSVSGDFSNADIQGTAAQDLALSYATRSFTVAGATLDPGVSILIRFTSVIQITSALTTGTGTNSFNNPRVQYAGRF